MKRFILWLLSLMALTLIISGCTRTIEGIQEDTCNVWHGTKHVIHEATAD